MDLERDPLPLPDPTATPGELERMEYGYCGLYMLRHDSPGNETNRRAMVEAMAADDAADAGDHSEAAARYQAAASVLLEDPELADDPAIVRNRAIAYANMVLARLNANEEDIAARDLADLRSRDAELGPALEQVAASLPDPPPCELVD